MNKPRKKRKKKYIPVIRKTGGMNYQTMSIGLNKPRLHSDNINKGVLSDPFALRQYWAHISKKKKKKKESGLTKSLVQRPDMKK